LRTEEKKNLHFVTTAITKKWHVVLVLTVVALEVALVAAGVAHVLEADLGLARVVVAVLALGLDLVAVVTVEDRKRLT
jgi:hypothetical protein